MDAHKPYKHSAHISSSGKHQGLCMACIARMGSGNRTRGLQKKRIALSCHGQVAVKPREKKHIRRSVCVEGSLHHRQELLRFLGMNADPADVVKYVDKILHSVLQVRSAFIQLVTLVEGPCGIDSEIAKANAEL